MDILQTITKPWRDPVDYLTLVFWAVIFMIVAVVLYDAMRVLGSFLKSAVD